MRAFLYSALSAALLLVSASADAGTERSLEIYRPGKCRIYHKGWIDFNKNGRMDVYEDPSAALDDRIENLLSQMNLDEKTCQMATLYGYQRVLRDDLPDETWKEKIWKDGIGAIDEHLNGFKSWSAPVSDNPYVWPASRHTWAMNEVQRFFVEETRLGIPVDFTNEGIRGIEAYRATNFPTQLGIGHTWNRELVRKIGEITGQEARLLGYTNVYAPILDVGRDQRWGRYEEIYGESPFLVAELGIQMVEGLQKDYQVAATAKHFIAYSNNKGAREGMSRVDPQMSPREVENIHVYPWKRVIREAGLLGAMSSYNDYDGEPVQSSSYWLQDRLRKDFGFKGYVVSDSDAVEYLHTKHRTSESMKESVRQSVEAGLNVRCTFRSPDSYILPLRELIEEGTLPMEMIDERVRDILRVKFLVGMFDDPYQRNLKAADAIVDGVANNEIALEASRESIVLLKNENLLPLDRKALKKIAVVGPNADVTSYANTHYGPLATANVSVLEGLRTLAGENIEVIYSKGCELVDANWPISEIMPFPLTSEEEGLIAEAVGAVADADVIIAVMGGGQRTCGENKSRSSLELPGRQRDLLMALEKTGKPMVVTLINGRPLSINWTVQHADAIVEAWYPGSHGGTAVAEVIFGDYNPGGKLTVTFPKTVGQIPFNFPYKPNSQVDGNTVPGMEGNQTRINGPLYSFGHGLSYTTFEYSNLSLSKKILRPDENLEVMFEVTNTGERKGDEIVQLYIQDKISSVTTYDLQLRGFERVKLEPGETKTVRMVLHPDDFKLLDKKMDRVLEPGEFDICINSSLEDTRLKETVIYTDPEGKYEVPALLSSVELFPAVLKKGDELTLPLKDEARIDALTIHWAKGTDCRFEISTTNGGGQFIQAMTDSADGARVRTCHFSRRKASEVRVTVLEGKAVISKIENNALK